MIEYGGFAILSHVFRLNGLNREISTGSWYLYSQKENDQFETALFHKGESGDLHSSFDLLQSGLAQRLSRWYSIYPYRSRINSHKQTCHVTDRSSFDDSEVPVG